MGKEHLVDLVLFPLTCLVVWVSFSDSIDEKWGFIPYDDDQNFEDQEDALETMSLADWNTWLWAFQKIIINVWEPLAWIAKILLIQTFGFQAKTIRIGALVCHTLSSSMLYYFCIRFLRFADSKNSVSPVPEFCLRLFALCGSLIFASHPTSSQVIGWASAFPYSTSLLFHLAATSVYILPRLSNSLKWQEASRLQLFASSFLFVLSTLSKSYSTFTPFVLGMMELFWLNFPVLELTICKFMWLLFNRSVFLIALQLQYSIALQATAPCAAGMFQLNTQQRACIFALSLVNMVSIVFWPVHLLLNYGFVLNDLDPETSLRTKWSFLVVSVWVLASLISLSGKESRLYGVLAIWFLMAIVPGSGLVQHNSVRLGDDRYVYFGIPAVSLALSLTQLRLYCFGRKLATPYRWYSHAILVLVPVLVIFGYVHINKKQIQVWRSAEELYSHTLYFNPRDWSVKYSRLTVLNNRHDDLLKEESEEFIQLFEEEVYTHSAVREVKRRLVLLHLRSFDESCIEYKELASTYVPDEGTNSPWAPVFNNLAVCHLVHRSAPLDVATLLLWKAGNITECKSVQIGIEHNLATLAKYSIANMSIEFLLLK